MTCLGAGPASGPLVGQATAIRAQLSRDRGSGAPGASALTAGGLRLLLSTHLSFPHIAGEMFLSRHTIKSQAMFVVALPYGSDSDWVKNVRAHGTAVIIYHGSEYRVDHPAVVPLGMAEDSFSPRDRRAHRLFGVTECLTARRVPADELASPAGIRRGTENRC
jgi:hypothetical protein